MVQNTFNIDPSNFEYKLGGKRLTFQNKVNVENSFFDYYQINDNNIDRPKIISNDKQILVLDESENYILMHVYFNEDKLIFQTYINTKIELHDNKIRVSFVEGYKSQSFLMHEYSDTNTEYDYNGFTLTFSEDSELASYKVIKSSVISENSAEFTVIRDINDNRGDYLFSFNKMDEGISVYNNVPYSLEVFNNKLELIPVVDFFDFEENITTSLGSYNIQHTGHGKLYKLNEQSIYVWGADHFPNLSSLIKTGSVEDFIHIHNLGDSFLIQEDIVVIRNQAEILSHEDINSGNFVEQETLEIEDLNIFELKFFSIFFPKNYFLYKKSSSELYCIMNKENTEFFIHFQEDENGSINYDSELFTNTFINYKKRNIFYKVELIMFDGKY